MSLARFISSRIRHQHKGGSARPIVWIAQGAIALGMITMMISIGLVNGFQKEIKSKMVGFGGHLKISANMQNGGESQSPILRDTTLEASLLQHGAVKSVNATAHLPGIIESKKDLQGVILKGVDDSDDHDFLNDVLIEGELPQWGAQENDTVREIVISSFLQKELSAEVGKKLSVYFLTGHETPRQQNFVVKGIYESGLEEFDHKIVFISLRQLQHYAHFGITPQVVIESEDNQQVTLNGDVVGSHQDFEWYWKVGNEKIRAWQLVVSKNQNLPVSLVAHDLRLDLRDSVAVLYQDSVTTIQQFDTPNDHLIGSYEIALKDFDELYEAQRGIYDLIPFQLGIENVLEQHPEIIAWLQMLDINVIIIIVLMIVISIINMTSALLIIILEKQNFIGTFKAMGMSNWQLLKVFVLHSIGLISKGLLWGNGIGLGLMLIQKYTGIIQLDPNQYYVKEVPIDIQWTYILALNIGVIVVCALAMMLPAAYVSKISPIKAIRFN